MRHGTDRGDDHTKRSAALSLDWPCLVAVAVPALVYIGVIVAHYGGRPYLRGDCQYYFYSAVSLIEDHDVDLMNNLPAPLSRHSDDVSLDRKGRLVPKRPIWMAVFALVRRCLRRSRGPDLQPVAACASSLPGVSIHPEVFFTLGFGSRDCCHRQSFPFFPIFSCGILARCVLVPPACRRTDLPPRRQVTRQTPALPCGLSSRSGRRLEVFSVSCSARPPTVVRLASSKIHTGSGVWFRGANGLLVRPQRSPFWVAADHVVRPHGKNRG